MLLGHSVTDADGIILTLDETLCDMFQRPKRDLVGMSYMQLTHPDDRERNRLQVSALAVDEGPLRFRKRYLRAEGDPVWTAVEASRLETGPGAGRLVGSIHLLDANRLDESPKSLRRAAVRIDAIIRRRREELGDVLFGDHAWIILLQVYLGEAEGRVIEPAEIGETTKFTAGLIERWLKVFELERLVERPGWNGCAIQLTARGLEKVEKLLAVSVEA